MEGLVIIGRTGQLARHLALQAPAARLLGREAADLTRPQDCAEAILSARPRAVINAAAFTAVDAAEADPVGADLVNAAAPAAMAAACARLGVPFLHVSTDYVFDGSGNAPWSEGDDPAPLNAYGRSKRAGEVAISAAGGRWAVLRTAWVFSEYGRNFVKTILRLAADRPRLTIVGDQIGCPTPAADLAGALLSMARAMVDDPSRGGLYHYAGAPAVSWAGFATEIVAQARLPAQIAPIPTRDYPTPAARPLNGRLDCSRIARDFGIAQPDWRAGLAAVLAHLPHERSERT